MSLRNLLNFTLLVLGITFFCQSCQKSGSKDSVPGEPVLTASNPLLELLPGSETGIDFKNMIEETFDLNITTHVNTSNGGGVAVLDVNNDGLRDLYFISSSGDNKLYLNEGSFKFKDITKTAGVEGSKSFESAVTIVDINMDGYQDIYICCAGPLVNDERRNILYINNRDNTFTNKAKLYNLDDKSACMGAAFFDYDQDGDLDLYLVNYPINFSYASKVRVKPGPDSLPVPNLEPIEEFDSDRFYRNDGLPTGTSGGFTDVSKEAGIWNFAYGLCVSIEDFNNDGWMDVYVSNDFIQPDLLYINNKNGSFTDRLGDYFKHTTQHSMGTDLSDFNNDGLFDLVCLDMWSKSNVRKKTLPSTNSQNKYTTLISNNYFEPVVRNVVQKNNGNGTFSDVAYLTDIAQTDWSWSVLLGDLNNDTYKDMLITNGYQREVTDADFINFTFADIKHRGSLQSQYKDIHEFLSLIPQYKIRNFHFKNTGDLNFEEVSGQWLDVPPSWSNGAVLVDLDNDGDLDYVVNNIDQEAFVYRNKQNQNKESHYLQVTLKGPASNPDAIGSSIRIFTKNTKQYHLVTPNRGIFSSQDLRAHFGLGTDTSIDRIEVRWPDGKGVVLENVSADQNLEINYDATHLPLAPYKEDFDPWFTRVHLNNPAINHRENPFSDFENIFLLPCGYSELGPFMDTCDINKDGLTDFFIGNSFDAPGGLYIQKSNNTFEKMSPEVWQKDALFEDQGCIFFDVDADGDKDLLVISGGYESTSSQAFQPRLYINENGKSLTRVPDGILPELGNACSRGVAVDFDLDGDFDIIIGGRISNDKKFPLAPKSYVLRNDRNKFTDVTELVAPQLAEIGMVTDLTLCQLDDDPQPELVVIGEWMPIQVFDITSNGIQKNNTLSSYFANSEGFWNRILPVDLDNDGDIDFITGNIGLNSQFKADKNHPIQCYALDVDGNGSIDPILTYYEGEKIYPFVQKDVLIKQIPALKKKYVYYKDYGSATIQDILNPKQLDAAHILNARILESGWWENRGTEFVFHPFPKYGQTSITNSILCDDFNKDGHLDVLLIGNKYAMEVENGRLDSGIGTMLVGDGKGNFEWIDNRQTGIFADQNARDICILKSRLQPDSKVILVANNNGPLIGFKSK